MGILLATLLLWPNLNDILAPLTYGRWMPVHHNAQLYGWCALPLVGLLLRAYLTPGPLANRHTLLALGAWSAALLFGAVSWLRGEASGKLFLDWSGPARIAFPLALCVLWAVLAHHAFARLAASHHRPNLPLDSRRSSLVRFALLLALLFVPIVMHYSADPHTFPPVNPDSGGATGVSLYGSTLGLIAIYAAMPWMVALPLKPGRRRSRLTGPALGGAFVVFAFVDHGHASHHGPDQIAALALLFLAPPLLARDWRRFAWKTESHRWLVASLAWGAFLVADGWVTFLPGFSERLKFTNGLVAHAHLAMAGLVTSIGMVFLLQLGVSTRVATALGDRRAFWLWQLATTLHVTVLLALGWFEGANPWLVLGGTETARLVYAVRLAAGTAMTVSSIWWLIAQWRRPAAAPNLTP